MYTKVSKLSGKPDLEKELTQWAQEGSWVTVKMSFYVGLLFEVCLIHR